MTDVVTCARCLGDGEDADGVLRICWLCRGEGRVSPRAAAIYVRCSVTDHGVRDLERRATAAHAMRVRRGTGFEARAEVLGLLRVVLAEWSRRMRHALDAAVQEQAS